MKMMSFVLSLMVLKVEFRCDYGFGNCSFSGIGSTRSMSKKESLWESFKEWESKNHGYFVVIVGLVLLWRP